MSGLIFGIGLIAAGVLHVMAVQQQWPWFMNSYQIRISIEKYGLGFTKLYAFATSVACIGAGIYMMSSVFA